MLRSVSLLAPLVVPALILGCNSESPDESSDTDPMNSSGALPETDSSVTAGDDAGTTGDGETGETDDPGEPFVGESVDFPLPPFRESVAVDIDVRQIEVSAGVAHVAAGDDGLLLFDIHEPHSLSRVGATLEGSTAVGLQLIGDVAYVGLGEEGLAAVDVSDPAAPTVLGQLEGISAERFFAGEHLFVAGQGVHIVDISTPSSPTLVVSVPGCAQDVTVLDDVAYYACSSGVRRYDVSDPANPVEISGVFSEINDPTRVATHEGFLYSTGGTGTGIRVFSLSGSFPQEIANFGAASDLVFDAGLYAANMRTLSHYDVSDPTDPLLVDARQRDVNVDAIAPLEGQYLIGTSPPGSELTGLRVVSREPEPPARVQGVLPLDSINIPDGLSANGDDIAYLVAWDALHVVDVSTPTQPVVTNEILSVFEGGRDIVVDGASAYLQSNAGLEVFDVSAPETPVHLGTYDASVQSFAVVGGVPVVVETSGFVSILDMSVPSLPTVHAQIEAERFARVTGDDSRMFVIEADSRTVNQFDISAPGRPTLINTMTMPNCGPQDAQLVGEMLAVTCFSGAGFRTGTVNADPQAEPVEFTGEVETYDQARGRLHASDGLALVADGMQGLTVIDIADVARPRVIGNFIGPRFGDPVLTDVIDVQTSGTKMIFADRTDLVAIPSTLVSFDGAPTTAAPGETLVLDVEWTDIYLDDNEETTCRATGGRCSVTQVDQGAHSLVVEWLAPTEPGDYEVAVAVGNKHYFAAARTRVRVF